MFGGSPPFDDHIGTGGAGNFWTYQTFSATDANNPGRALAVIEQNGEVKGIIGIHATSGRVHINGNDLLQNGAPLKWCNIKDLVPGIT